MNTVAADIFGISISCGRADLPSLAMTGNRPTTKVSAAPLFGTLPLGWSRVSGVECYSTNVGLGNRTHQSGASHSITISLDRKKKVSRGPSVASSSKQHDRYNQN